MYFSRRNIYWLCARFDSQLFLKLIIVFNFIIGICLLSVTTSSWRDKDLVNHTAPDPFSNFHSQDFIVNHRLKSENFERVNNVEYNFESSSDSTNIVQENDETIWWTAEVRGKYVILQNYIQGSIQVESNMKTITLTTQGTYDFLHHVKELSSRWEGFISVSVYAPGEDFRLVVNAIYYLRQCSTDSVSERIYWHLVYDTLYPPDENDLEAPTSYLVTENFDCSIPLDESMQFFNLKSQFRENHSLPYPINVLRNVARAASKSKYVFATDIELYPSVGIVRGFFDLFEREKNGQVPLIDSTKPHVYLVPIFEVKSNLTPPRTKPELISMFEAGDAVFFHRYVCDICQNFPDRNIWIKQIPLNDTLNIFRVTKRTRERSSWEPLYIGTNSEPFYDERLTWDGKKDKMAQMYEMCLMNYNLLVLDNAFLVHAPGIKFYHIKDDIKRIPFKKANEKIHNLLYSQLRAKYGTNNKC